MNTDFKRIQYTQFLHFKVSSSQCNIIIFISLSPKVNKSMLPCSLLFVVPFPSFRNRVPQLSCPENSSNWLHLLSQISQLLIRFVQVSESNVAFVIHRHGDLREEKEVDSSVLHISSRFPRNKFRFEAKEGET
jgi:hypothetical protein